VVQRGEVLLARRRGSRGGWSPEMWLEKASPDAFTAQPLEITQRLAAM